MFFLQNSHKLLTSYERLNSLKKLVLKFLYISQMSHEPHKFHTNLSKISYILPTNFLQTSYEPLPNTFQTCIDYFKIY
jgi:hypothetical protein